MPGSYGLPVVAPSVLHRRRARRALFYGEDAAVDGAAIPCNGVLAGDCSQYVLLRRAGRHLQPSFRAQVTRHVRLVADTTWPSRQLSSGSGARDVSNGLTEQAELPNPHSAGSELSPPPVYPPVTRWLCPAGPLHTGNSPKCCSASRGPILAIIYPIRRRRDAASANEWRV